MEDRKWTKHDREVIVSLILIGILTISVVVYIYSNLEESSNQNFEYIQARVENFKGAIKDISFTNVDLEVQAINSDETLMFIYDGDNLYYPSNEGELGDISIGDVYGVKIKIVTRDDDKKDISIVDVTKK